jgi:hypothetical protein
MLPPALDAIRNNLRRATGRTKRQDQILRELDELDRLLSSGQPMIKSAMDDLEKRANQEMSGPIPGGCPCCGR